VRGRELSTTAGSTRQSPLPTAMEELHIAKRPCLTMPPGGELWDRGSPMRGSSRCSHADAGQSRARSSLAGPTPVAESPDPDLGLKRGRQGRRGGGETCMEAGGGAHHAQREGGGGVESATTRVHLALPHDGGGTGTQLETDEMRHGRWR
jgi:hypothetical protein